MYRPLSYLLSLVLCAASLGAQAQHDPMRPAGTAVIQGNATALTSAPSYRLDAIISTGERRSAVINGHHLGEGDMVDRARVVRIEPTRVILRAGSQQQELNLLPLRIKTPSNEAAHE